MHSASTEEMLQRQVDLRCAVALLFLSAALGTGRLGGVVALDCAVGGEKAMRFDCLPDHKTHETHQTTEAACKSRGCCWRPGEPADLEEI